MRKIIKLAKMQNKSIFTVNTLNIIITVITNQFMEKEKDIIQNFKYIYFNVVKSF